MVDDRLGQEPTGRLALFWAALTAMLLIAVLLFSLALAAGLERAHATRAACAVFGMHPEPADSRSLDVLCVDPRDGKVFRPA